MPAYEFACEKCGHVFTIERPMSGTLKAPACPECRSSATHQVLSAFYAKTIKKS